MEQVARRNAGPGDAKNRVRSARRPACVACQTKKVRHLVSVIYFYLYLYPSILVTSNHLLSPCSSDALAIHATVTGAKPD